MAITGNSIDLVWTAATDNIAVTDYKIYKSDDGVTYDSGTSVGNVLSYTYSGLTADTQYWFKITALDAALNESNFSNIVTDTTLPFLLDAYTGAAAAYSLRKLRTGETYAVEVRRSSDNATTDVELYSDGSSIDLSSTVSAGGTLGTWVGSNSAYVKTWYDQSGNDNDLSQTTNSDQPILVDAGSLVQTNGKASINNNDTALLQSSRVLSTGLWSIHAVFEFTSLSRASNQFINQHTGAADNGRTIWVNHQSGNPDHCMYINVGGTGYSGEYSSNWELGQYHISNYGDNNDYYFSRNGDTPELLISGQSHVPLNTNFNIGGYGNGTNPMYGNYQEVIVYASNQSSNRTAIETNINNHYSIF